VRQTKRHRGELRQFAADIDSHLELRFTGDGNGSSQSKPVFTHRSLESLQAATSQKGPRWKCLRSRWLTDEQGKD